MSTTGARASLDRRHNLHDVPWIEATILDLQALMRSGEITSLELTHGYLAQIDRLDDLLGSVIETNSHASAIAARLDQERRRGKVRGALHGIPVLLKDNIATADPMETTAGSLALVGCHVAADARIVDRLRSAGPVILGKANLSEWANVPGFGTINAWSARGGFTRDLYLLSFDPCGSSSGSAVATAANLCGRKEATIDPDLCAVQGTTPQKLRVRSQQLPTRPRRRYHHRGRGREAMTALGVILIDTDTDDALAYFFDEGTVLVSELRA